MQHDCQYKHTLHETNMMWALTTGRSAKALELFLAMIVEEASNVTVERGSKRVEAYHLCVPSPLASHSSSIPPIPHPPL